MSQKFHKFWLLITAFVIWSFGPVFFLGTMPATAEPARLTLDLLSWPLDGMQTFADPDTRFLSALTGGFLLGWGIMILGLRAWVYDAAPEGVRRAVLAGLLAWFVLDTPRMPSSMFLSCCWRLAPCGDRPRGDHARRIGDLDSARLLALLHTLVIITL